MKSSDIQYRYALVDVGEDLVNIDAVDVAYRSNHSFTCPCCGKKMEAVIVTERAHHFRHSNSEEACNYNKYLHSTAEETFYVEYKHCLEYGKPFTISVFEQLRCDPRCVADKVSCSKQGRQVQINLTEKFVSISPEKRIFVDGHYRRPDLLLESRDGEQLWVEIWVKHRTSEEKLKEGVVLELKITEENDIDKIRTHSLVQKTHSDNTIRLYSSKECLSPELHKPYIGVEEKPTFHESSFIEDKSPKERPQEVDHFDYPKSVHPSYKPFGITHSSVFIKTDRVLVPKVSTYWKSQDKPEWIDLGLPSGTLWSNNLMGIMTLDEAQTQYPDNLPTVEQVEELLTLCRQSPDYNLVGQNGRHLELWEGDFLVNNIIDGKVTCLHRENLPVYKGESVQNELCKTDAKSRLCVRLVK